jgi:tetratricopeptide (TPR) repeat protein
MIATGNNGSPSVSEYIGLLLQLHELMTAGRGGSDEADVVRDRMDAPWARLRRDELKLVDGLSADLYSLGVNRAAAPATPANAAALRDFERAVRERRWPTVLEIIRENEEHLDARTVAYLRAASWAQLGEPDVALLFLAESARWHTLAAEEEIWWLTCMIHAGRATDALPRAREIADASDSPLLMLAAAEVLFVAAAEGPGCGENEVHREAVELAERGLAAAATAPRDDLLDSLRTGALIHLALTYDHFGNRLGAIEACNRALQIDPERKIALELLGFLSYDNFPVSQRALFRHRLHQELAAETKSGSDFAMVEAN